MLLAGELLENRFRLGPLLGRGGMADVYRADDEETGEPVAIKLLRGLEPSDLRRFEAEASTLEHLDHPSIVRLRGVGEHDGMPFLVLDLVEGSTLAAELEGGSLDVDRAVAIAASVSGALAHAHEAGVVHRDVKPGNILLDDDDHAHLADFGIARLAGATALTLSGKVVGTATYLAPEQVRGRATGPAADVYALGLVMLETVTGQRPFPGSPAESATARLHRLPDIPASLPTWLAEVVASMTAIDAASRPRAADVAAALADRSSAVVMPGGSPPPRDGTSVMPALATSLDSVLAAEPVGAGAGGGASVPPRAYVPAPEPEPDYVPVEPARPAALAAAGSLVAGMRRHLLATLAALIIVVVALAALAADGVDVPAVATSSSSSTVTQFTTTTTAPTTTLPPTTAPRGKGKHKNDGD